MNIVLKERERRTFEELEVGDIFIEEKSNEVYMKVEIMEHLKTVYECDGNIVCLNNGRIGFANLSDEVFKINGTFTEEI